MPANGGEEQPVHDLPPTGYWGHWDIGNQGLYYVKSGSEAASRD
jgi:hypothetical protein